MKTKLRSIAFFVAVLLCILPVFLSCGKSNSRTVMEYKGICLTEDMYNYWVSTFKRNILTYYDDAEDTEAFWQKKMDDNTTYEDYFNQMIEDRIANYLIAQSLCKDHTLKLSSDVKNAIKDDIDEKIDYYGGRSGLNKALGDLMLDIDGLEKVYTWEEKHSMVKEYLFGTNGIEALDDKDIEEYYKRNYSRIRYIAFYLTKIETDENGDPVRDGEGNPVTSAMTEEELNAERDKIAACKKELDDGADFDDMIKKYSEYDPKAYPNGFFVSANELETWGVQIVLAAGAAEPGDIFRVDEAEAVYLIRKLELTDMAELSESDMTQLSALVGAAEKERYDARFGELRKNVTVDREVISGYSISKVKANPHYSF